MIMKVGTYDWYVGIFGINWTGLQWVVIINRINRTHDCWDEYEFKCKVYVTLIY
jgi:hypothetical protein